MEMERSAQGTEAKAAGIKGAESSALGAGASQRRPSASQRHRDTDTAAATEQTQAEELAEDATSRLDRATRAPCCLIK